MGKRALHATSEAMLARMVEVREQVENSREHDDLRVHRRLPFRGLTKHGPLVPSSDRVMSLALSFSACRHWQLPAAARSRSLSPPSHGIDIAHQRAARERGSGSYAMQRA